MIIYPITYGIVRIRYRDISVTIFADYRESFASCLARAKLELRVQLAIQEERDRELPTHMWYQPAGATAPMKIRLGGGR